MKLKTLTIGVGRTYNIGNFESYRIDGAVEIEFDEEHTPKSDAWALAFGMLRNQMAATFKEFKPSRLKADTVKDKFLELKDVAGAPVARTVIASLGYRDLAHLLEHPETYFFAYAAAESEIISNKESKP